MAIHERGPLKPIDTNITPAKTPSSGEGVKMPQDPSVLRLPLAKTLPSRPPPPPSLDDLFGGFAASMDQAARVVLAASRDIKEQHAVEKEFAKLESGLVEADFVATQAELENVSPPPPSDVPPARPTMPPEKKVAEEKLPEFPKLPDLPGDTPTGIQKIINKYIDNILLDRKAEVQIDPEDAKHFTPQQLETLQKALQEYRLPPKSQSKAAKFFSNILGGIKSTGASIAAKAIAASELVRHKCLAPLSHAVRLIGKSMQAEKLAKEIVGERNLNPHLLAPLKEVIERKGDKSISLENRHLLVDQLVDDAKSELYNRYGPKIKEYEKDPQIAAILTPRPQNEIKTVERLLEYGVDLKTGKIDKGQLVDRLAQNLTTFLQEGAIDKQSLKREIKDRLASAQSLEDFTSLWKLSSYPKTLTQALTDTFAAIMSSSNEDPVHLQDLFRFLFNNASEQVTRDIALNIAESCGVDRKNPEELHSFLLRLHNEPLILNLVPHRTIADLIEKGDMSDYGQNLTKALEVINKAQELSTTRGERWSVGIKDNQLVPMRSQFATEERAKGASEYLNFLFIQGASIARQLEELWMRSETDKKVISQFSQRLGLILNKMEAISNGHTLSPAANKHMEIIQNAKKSIDLHLGL